MDPTTDMKQIRDALISRVDEQLSQVHERIKSADEQLASMEAQLSRQGVEVPRSHPKPRPRRRLWLRGVAGLLLAGYIVAVALVSQSSYGDAVAGWAPQLISALTLPLEKLMLLSQPNPSSVHLVAAEQAPSLQVAPHNLAPTTVPAVTDQAKSLETMARDLANLEREIEQLKANQQQLASDNAAAIEQIKASQEQAARDLAKNVESLKESQEQMAQLIARASEQSLRPRTLANTSARTSSAQTPQGAIGARKPLPTAATSQASARSQPQTPLRTEQR